MALAQLSFGAHDPRWPEHHRVPSGSAVMTLFDNEVAAIVALRRKRRSFSYIAEEIVCRDVIRCALAGCAALGIAGRVDRLLELRRGFWRCFRLTPSGTHAGP
jgi:hypothetical protein